MGIKSMYWKYRNVEKKFDENDPLEVNIKCSYDSWRRYFGFRDTRRMREAFACACRTGKWYM